MLIQTFRRYDFFFAKFDFKHCFTKSNRGRLKSYFMPELVTWRHSPLDPLTTRLAASHPETAILPLFGWASETTDVMYHKTLK